MSLVLFAVFALLYGLTLPHQYTYDGLCYALDAERAPTTNIFHPGHLLYSATMRLLWKFSGVLGYHGPALYWMQVVNILAASAAVAALGMLLARKTDKVTAAAGAALFGVSYAFWFEAADSGCYAFAALAAVGCLWLLVETSFEKPFWTGFAHGFCVLFHQMLVLLALSFTAQAIFSTRENSSRLKRISLYTAGLVLACVVPYAIVAIVFHGTSWHDAFYWALGPAGPPPGTPILSSYWWGTDFFKNIHAFAGALSGAFVSGSPLSGVLGALMAVGLVVLAVQRGRQVPLWVWLAALGTFQFFFAPGAMRFRILLLPPLLYLALANRKAPWLWGVVVLALSVNFTPIYEKTKIPPEAARVAWVRQALTPADLLIYAGEGTQSFGNVYFVYFAPHHSGQSIKGYRFSHPDGNFYELEERIRAVRARGGRVFMEEGVWNPAYKKGQVLEGPAGYKLFQIK